MFRPIFAMPTRAQSAWNKIAVLTLLEEGRVPHFQTIDNLRIQKLGFRSEIRGKELGQYPAFFTFFRYDLGPYSKELANEVSALEARDFVNSESRCLTWRGKYLLEYFAPQIAELETARAAVGVIKSVCEECRSIRASSVLVDKTYAMQVPVADYGDAVMTVRDIPMKTDIIIPDPRFAPISQEMVEEIEEEWSISPSSLDPNSRDLIEAVDSAYRRVLAM